jgi:hypothetical protein
MRRSGRTPKNVAVVVPADVLHTYSFAVGRLDLLVPLCDYMTLVQPSGKAGFGRGRHDALASAAGKRPNLAASEASTVNCDTRTR